MAEIAYLEEIIKITNARGDRREILVVSWPGIVAGSTCQEYEKAGLYPDKTLMVSGTPGGSTLAIQGRNLAGEPPLTVNDAEGAALSFAAAPASPKLLRENPVSLIPLLTGGDGTTTWTVSINLGSIRQ